MKRMLDIEKNINDIKEYAELLDKYRALEEENKELREWKENLIRADKKKSDHIDELEEENKKLKEERDSWKDNYMQETRVWMDECKKLREENEELKEYKAMYEGLC